jgi:hypothetical protein
MKIFYTTQNVNKDILLKGIEEIKKHQSRVNLNFEFIDLGETNTHFPIKYLNTNQRLLDSTAIFKDGLSKGYVFGQTNILMHVYDWNKYNPTPTNPANDGLVIQMPKQFWNDSIPDILAQYFYHELCHFYFSKTGKADITHNYHPDFAQRPRIDWYLHLLKDLHLLVENKPILPIVTLKRGYGDRNQQLGDLMIDGFTCKTLELSWKNNQRNISCIPTGEYEVKRKFSFKFGWVYEIQNVPNRTNIYFHSGNTFFDIQGCILLGTHYGDLNKDESADIFNSKITVKKFEDFMNKKPFILRII